MGKYRRISFLMMISMLILLSGCAKEEKEPIEITIIHAWGGVEDDHVAMRSIYEDFQKENPDIKLQLISMPTRAEMQRKTEDMLMVGKIPDIVTFSGFGRNPTYDFMIENGMALDLIPYLEKDGELRDSISDMNLKYWTTEDHQLFTVADVISLSGGYWYNKEILEQAGIRELPQNWDAFLEMCEKIQNWSETQELDIQAHQVSAEGYLYFMNQLLADNIDEENFKKEHEKEIIGSKQFEEAIEQLKSIYSFSAAASSEYSYLDETSLFNEGKLAIYVNGVWGASMIHSNIDVGYAPIPTQSGVSTACQSSSLGYVLGKTGNQDKERAAVKFLKYMLSEPVQKRILRETEQIPANPNVSLEEFAAEKTRLYNAAMQVLNTERKIRVPDKEGEFTNNITAVLSGEMSEQEFIEKLSLQK